MSVNPNGEAEILKVYFKPRPRLKKLIVDLNFSELAIKGRQSQGNLFSRYAIHKIVLKERGASTLGGVDVWYDDEIRRLNTDGRGELLGEFVGDDKLIVMTGKGLYYTANYDLGPAFPGGHDPRRKIRQRPDLFGRLFRRENRTTTTSSGSMPNRATTKCRISSKTTAGSYMVAINSDTYPQLQVVYGGHNAGRPDDTIDVDEFIGVKSHRAKGKRVTTLDVDKIVFAEPLDKEPRPEETPGRPSERKRSGRDFRRDREDRAGTQQRARRRRCRQNRSPEKLRRGGYRRVRHRRRRRTAAEHQTDEPVRGRIM